MASSPARGAARRGAARPLAAAAALVLAAGCGDDLPGPDLVARLDGHDVHHEDFEEYLEQHAASGSALPSASLSGLLDQLLDEEALRLWAIEQGLAEEDVGRRQALEALLARDPTVHPTAAEVEGYYRANSSQFESPEQVQLRQILFDDREAAAAARQSWTAGMPFTELVQRFRDRVGASQEAGALLGRDDLPPVFVDTIFDLEPGEVSEMVATDYGFHLFQVVERRPAARRPLAEAAPEIERQLRSGRAARRREELVRAARQRYNPRVFARNLPFDYTGLHASP